MRIMTQRGNQKRAKIKVNLRGKHPLMARAFLDSCGINSRTMSPNTSWKLLREWPEEHEKELKASTWSSNSPDLKPIQNCCWLNLTDTWPLELACGVPGGMAAGTLGPVGCLHDPSHGYSIGLGFGEFGDKVDALSSLTRVKRHQCECQDPRCPSGTLHCNQMTDVIHFTC